MDLYRAVVERGRALGGRRGDSGSARDLKPRGIQLLSHGYARNIYRSSSEYSSLSLNMAICGEAIQIHAQLYRLRNGLSNTAAYVNT